MAKNLNATMNMHCDRDGLAVRFDHLRDYSEVHIGHEDGVAMPICLFVTKRQIGYLGEKCLVASGEEMRPGEQSFLDVVDDFRRDPTSSYVLSELAETAARWSRQVIEQDRLEGKLRKAER